MANAYVQIDLVSADTELLEDGQSYFEAELAEIFDLQEGEDVETLNMPDWDNRHKIHTEEAKGPGSAALEISSAIEGGAPVSAVRYKIFVESDVKFVRPPALEAMLEEMKADWRHLESLSVWVYEKAIESGMKKEDARFALLAGSETELNLCLNFQAWQDFLRNRAAKHAQWEVQAVAYEIQRHLHELAPELFGETHE
jgi:hypothetical protein